MTNFEKYKDDLMEIEGVFAFNKHTKKIVKCNKNISCRDCVFNFNCLERNKIKWLYEEHEEFILSDNELKLIKDISEVTNKEYKYVHRSGNHVLLFCDKPPIDKYGILLDETDYIDISGHMHLFSNIEFMNGLYDIKDECFIEI